MATICLRSIGSGIASDSITIPNNVNSDIDGGDNSDDSLASFVDFLNEPTKEPNQSDRSTPKSVSFVNEENEYSHSASDLTLHEMPPLPFSYNDNGGTNTRAETSAAAHREDKIAKAISTHPSRYEPRGLPEPAILRDGPKQRPRLQLPARNNDDVLRLEGLVLQKRHATHTEKTRYLVLDFKLGSISVYPKPPPSYLPSSRRLLSSRRISRRNISTFSVPSVRNLRSNAEKSIRRSWTSSLDESDYSEEEDLGSSQVTCENLTHISRKRHFAGGAWEPKFTIPGSVNWKIRDVENDSTMFQLVILPDREDDTEERHQSFSTYETMDSIDGTEELMGSSRMDSGRTVFLRSKMARHMSFRRSASSTSEQKERDIYQFRVLLDGNEKYVWLQAAAELGRLLDPINIERAKKLSLTLPSAISSKSHFAALRYAEWARLIDEKKNVSKLHFDIHAGETVKEGREKEESGQYNATRLLKIIPTYAYRNRRMTEKGLYRDMATASARWEDFREQTVGDREEEMIGSLHAEVLACHGLPKLDKLSLTDAVCYFVCGPYAFASDVIDGFLSPVWPSKSRRACIFPLFHAYQKLFVGVFDDDGAGQNDDYAGRVVIDMARLRPNSVYDIFLPLREYTNTYIKRSRGVIHLRLRVEWHDERKAVLSYLKLPKKTQELGNAVTLNCADHKAFRNVVLTVQGKDVPGRYKSLVRTGLQREMNLYVAVLTTTMKEQIRDIALYANPPLSLCIFNAWMHCIYANTLAYVPAYLMSGILILLLVNYFKYGADDDFNYGFRPISLREIIQVLLYGGPNTNYIKPLKMAGQNEATNDIHDHMEFPFSEAGRYTDGKFSHTYVDTCDISLEDEDDNSNVSRKMSLGDDKLSWHKARRSSFTSSFTRSSINGNGEANEVEEQIGESGIIANQFVPLHTNSSFSSDMINKDRFICQSNEQVKNDIISDKVWKRQELPEQNAAVKVESKSTPLKEEITHVKDILQQKTMRLFDDRLFIVDKADIDNSNGKENELDQAVGEKNSNPINAMIAEFAGPGLEGLKVGLSVCRSMFNLFTWRDPFLTTLFFLGSFFALFVLVIFPWRLIFFVMGLGAVGPQNWLIRVISSNKGKPEQDKSHDQNEDASENKRKKLKKKRASTRKIGEPSSYFQFHNHLVTDAGNDKREERSQKSTNSAHRAVVPYSPLLSRRFYDWPPDPCLSKVDTFSE